MIDLNKEIDVTFGWFDRRFSDLVFIELHRHNNISYVLRHENSNVSLDYTILNLSQAYDKLPIHIQEAFRNYIDNPFFEIDLKRFIAQEK
jgi:hypothetical protein